MTMFFISEEELIARIAWFYYHDGLTQNEIGTLFNIPRLKISRLLDKGKQQGIINLTINSQYAGCLELETQIKTLFKLKAIRVIPSIDSKLSLKSRLAVGASNLVNIYIQPNQMLAIGFGETTSKTLQHLNGYLTSKKIKLVTLSGGVGAYISGIGNIDNTNDVSLIPAPLRASNAHVAKIFKQENSVKNIILTACAADIAIVGIGAIAEKKQATILTSGYINEAEQLLLEHRHAVGDILGYFFDKKGTIIDNIPLHDELISLSLDELKKIPLVVGIAGGEHKISSILAALKGKLINGLVIDQQSANKLLAIQQELII